MVAREGFVYEQKPLSVTRNVVEMWSYERDGRWWSFVRGSTVLATSFDFCQTIILDTLLVDG